MSAAETRMSEKWQKFQTGTGRPTGTGMLLTAGWEGIVATRSGCMWLDIWSAWVHTQVIYC